MCIRDRCHIAKNALPRIAFSAILPAESELVISLLLFNRPGSVVANFTIYYSGFDSYQFVLLQDSIDVDHSIGKLELMPYPTQYLIGPNGNIGRRILRVDNMRRRVNRRLRCSASQI